MLRISHVSRRFGDKLAVSDVNLEIPQGQMVGIIGRSGAGKSTLLRMINRLTDATSGRIDCDGVDVLALKGRREEVRTLGERLNVAAVLEGSVRKVGGRIRVAAQLTSVNDGYQLWSRSYDRDGGDLFAMQDGVVGEIMAEIRGRLAGLGTVATAPDRRLTDDVEASAHYERARRAWGRPRRRADR